MHFYHFDKNTFYNKPLHRKKEPIEMFDEIDCIGNVEVVY